MLPSVTIQKLIACGASAMGKGGSTKVVFNNTLTRSLPILLAHNTEIMVIDSAAPTLSGIITGTANKTLSKSGVGDIILSGTNTYFGPTVIKEGTLTFSGTNANTNITIGTSGSSGAIFRAALASASLKSITTSSGATGSILEYANTGAATTLTIANAVVMNSALTIRKSNSANAGGINFAGNLSGGSAGSDTLIFGNLGGSIFSIAPGIGTKSYVGNVRFLTSNSSSYTLNGNIFTASSQVILDSGALLRNGITGTPIFNSLSGSGTWDNASAVGVTLIIGGNNGSASFSGLIANTAGTIAVTKNGTGTQTFNTNHTRTGITTLNNGILSVAVLANGGTTSSIGQSTNAASNLVFNGGTLQYTGSGHTTNRQFTVQAGGAKIDASGTGTLTWTGAPTFSVASNLNLKGTGVGIFQGIIDSAANGSVTKSDSGTWTLTAANTYTGATQVLGGSLIVNGSIASGSTVTINGGTLGGTGTINGPTTISNTAGSSLMGGSGAGSTGNLTLNAPVTFGGSTASLTVNTNGTSTVSTVTINLGILGSVNLNNITVNFGAGQNLNSGTYNIIIAGGLLTTLTGSATVGVKPANRTNMSLGISGGGDLQVTVS